MAREITVDGDVAYVSLSKGKVAVIDSADIPLVEGGGWYTSSQGYAVRTIIRDGKKDKLTMHRMLVDPKPGLLVDHINGDRLDNRRSNLREATKAQNLRNQRKQGRAKSAYKGVTWNKAAGKWQAQIRSDNRRIYLGLFGDEIAAHEAYCTAAVKLHGEFARFDTPSAQDPRP